MFQITILFLYAAAAVAFAMSRLAACDGKSTGLTTGGFVAGLAALGLHADILLAFFAPDRIGELALATVVSLISLELALTALLGAIHARLRGMAAGLLLLAAVLAIPMYLNIERQTSPPLTWQTQTHVVVSMLAYGLLSVGAIVAVFALVQERRLRAARVSAFSNLFAPLATTERLLFVIASAGFVGLALAVVSGLTFVDNLFTQGLIHKTTFSIGAMLVFGVLLLGRAFAGWRGRRAVYLYLGGFALLVLAYFGSRFVLEVLLHRSWG